MAAQKHVDVPGVQTVGKICDVPVINQVEGPHITTVETIAELPRTQTIGKIRGVPMVGEMTQGGQTTENIALQPIRQEAPAEHAQVTEWGAALPVEHGETVFKGGAPQQMGGTVAMNVAVGGGTSVIQPGMATYSAPPLMPVVQQGVAIVQPAMMQQGAGIVSIMITVMQPGMGSVSNVQPVAMMMQQGMGSASNGQAAEAAATKAAAAKAMAEKTAAEKAAAENDVIDARSFPEEDTQIIRQVPKGLPQLPLRLVCKNTFIDAYDEGTLEYSDGGLPAALFDTSAEVEERRTAYRRFRLGSRVGARGDSRNRKCGSCSPHDQEQPPAAAAWSAVLSSAGGAAGALAASAAAVSQAAVPQEGVDIDDDDEKKKSEELRAEFEPITGLMKEGLGDKLAKAAMNSCMAGTPCDLTTSGCGWSANMERITKAQSLRDSSMNAYTVPKKTTEVNPKHSIMTELRKKAAADKSDKTEKDLVWLLFGILLLTSVFNLDEPTHSAGRIHRMVELGPPNDDDDEGLGDDNDLPPLAEVEGAADEELKMDEVEKATLRVLKKNLAKKCL